jgi:hypothetical protein
MAAAGKASALLLLATSLQAGFGVTQASAIASLASSSGSIARELHGLFTNPRKTLAKHGSDLKAAFKGKPAPPPNPVPVPASGVAATQEKR